MESNDNSCLICEYEFTSTGIFIELKKVIGNREITKLQHMLDHHLEFKIAERENAQTLIHRVFTNTNEIVEQQALIMELLKLLLNNGANINAKDRTQQTVLHLAAKYRLTLVIDFLLRRGADLQTRDKTGNSILHFLIKTESQKYAKIYPTREDLDDDMQSQSLEKDSADFIRWMILKGLDVDYRNENGETSLDWAAKFKLLHILPILLEYTRDTNIVNNRNITPFQVFVESVPKFYKESGLKENESRWHEIYEIFINKGFSVNLVDESGCTLFHHALKQQRLITVKLMLKNFTNVDANDEHGNQVLHIVMNNLKKCSVESRREYYEIVRTLLFKGANANKTNDKGISPLIDAVWSAELTILQIFKESGANFDVTYKLSNLLHLFCKSLPTKSYDDSLKILHLLLDEEIDVNAEDKNGMTPLHFAVRYSGTDIIKKLIEYGANVNSKELSRGYTPLHTAVECNCEKAVIVLIKNEAEIDAKDNRGRTPLYIAAEFGLSSMMKRLIDSGANIECQEFDRSFTPLHEVVANNRQNLVKLLFDYGANFNATTKFGHSLLHLVTIRDKSIVGQLINYGAPIDLMDNMGLLPLNAAILRKDRQLVNDLLKFGADINDNAHVLKEEDYYHGIFSESINHHLIKLKAAELPIDDTFTSHKSGKFIFQRVYRKCLSEVENNLKKYKITDSLSLYDVLHMNNKSTCNYVENVKFKELINSSTLKREFPMYHVLISAAYHSGVQRRKMFEPAKVALQKLISLIIPELCLYEICCYLKNFQLRRLIAAASY